MGSYCSLDFDDLQVDSFKSEVPDFLISLFQESDRRCEPPVIQTDPHNDLDDDAGSVKYVTSRAVILERLDFLGISEEFLQRVASLRTGAPGRSSAPCCTPRKTRTG